MKLRSLHLTGEEDDKELIEKTTVVGDMATDTEMDTATVEEPAAQAKKAAKKPDFTADARYQVLVPLFNVSSAAQLNELDIYAFRKEAAKGIESAPPPPWPRWRQHRRRRRSLAQGTRPVFKPWTSKHKKQQSSDNSNSSRY